jgi:hypothetical protein
MGIIRLIAAALDAFASYYTLRRERLIYEMLDVSEERLIAIRERIEELRDKGDEKSTQAADQLVLLYQREKKKYETYLSSI